MLDNIKRKNDPFTQEKTWLGLAQGHNKPAINNVNLFMKINSGNEFPQASTEKAKDRVARSKKNKKAIFGHFWP